MTFFGTLEQSIQHFTVIGIPPPAKYTPTDYYLQVTDSSFSDDKKLDFEGIFCTSKLFFQLQDLLDMIESQGLARRLIEELGDISEGVKENTSPRAVTPERSLIQPATDIDGVDTMEKGHMSLAMGIDASQANERTSIWTQYLILLHRDMLIAIRDPTLYYLQTALVLVFGCLVGCVFYQLDYKIDSTMYFIPGGLLWIVMMMAYIQVFKVYHLRKADIRFEHEYANNSYYVIAFWLAELTTSAIAIAFYIPGVCIAYSMMGLPQEALGFLILLYWTVWLVFECHFLLILA